MPAVKRGAVSKIKSRTDPSCHDGIYDQLYIMLNDAHPGIILFTGGGWSMKSVSNQKFIDTIGAGIMFWYNKLIEKKNPSNEGLSLGTHLGLLQMY